MTMGIYWVYFKVGNNEMRLQVEAENRSEATMAGLRIARKMKGPIVWKYDCTEACR